MTREQWAWLPVRMALVLLGAGAAVLVGMWWGSGNQRFVGTQLPYVVVACGIGLGLVAVAGALYTAHVTRLSRVRVEDAAARLLAAADRLAAARRG